VSPTTAPLTAVFLVPFYFIIAGKSRIKSGMFAVVHLLKQAVVQTKKLWLTDSPCIMLFDLFFSDPPPLLTTVSIIFLL
jgi:hypothetical protein